MICEQNSEDIRQVGWHSHDMTEREQTFDISGPMRELIAATGIKPPALIRATGLSSGTIYNYLRGTRQAGMGAIRKIAQAFGVAWSVLVDSPVNRTTISGAVTRLGVFESPDSSHAGVGVGAYTVDGLDEIGASAGDVVTFVPATAADATPGRWLSVRVDGDVQLYQVVATDGGGLALRRPSKRALTEFVPSEHEVVGRLQGLNRTWD